MIKIDENDPIGEVDPSFPHRDVTIKRNTDMKQFYDLQKEIGRGKFGTVYGCTEKSTGLKLAAKFIGIAKRQDRRNAEREVGIMKEIQHPRIIQIYDAYEINHIMCVVLELVEGGELFERVIDDDFVLTEKSVSVFMRQICEGIAFIHSKNILHLDMKPENILCLTRTGNRIKIIDFGLARTYDPEKKLQVLFGTPEFVAPEVVNFDSIGFGTDMWSVGVICYVLLSGLSPFMGETDVQTMANVTIAQFDYDDEAFNSISIDAKDFISKLLLKNREDRMSASECMSHRWLKRRKSLSKCKLSNTIPLINDELDIPKDTLRNIADRWNIETNVVPIITTNTDSNINKHDTFTEITKLNGITEEKSNKIECGDKNSKSISVTEKNKNQLNSRPIENGEILFENKNSGKTEIIRSLSPVPKKQAKLENISLPNNDTEMPLQNKIEFKKVPLNEKPAVIRKELISSQAKKVTDTSAETISNSTKLSQSPGIIMVTKENSDSNSDEKTDTCIPEPADVSSSLSSSSRNENLLSSTKLPVVNAADKCLNDMNQSNGLVKNVFETTGTFIKEKNGKEAKTMQSNVTNKLGNVHCTDDKIKNDKSSNNFESKKPLRKSTLSTNFVLETAKSDSIIAKKSNLNTPTDKFSSNKRVKSTDSISGKKTNTSDSLIEIKSINLTISDSIENAKNKNISNKKNKNQTFIDSSEQGTKNNSENTKIKSEKSIIGTSSQEMPHNLDQSSISTTTIENKPNSISTTKMEKVCRIEMTDESYECVKTKSFIIKNIKKTSDNVQRTRDKSASSTESKKSKSNDNDTTQKTRVKIEKLKQNESSRNLLNLSLNKLIENKEFKDQNIDTLNNLKKVADIINHQELTRRRVSDISNLFSTSTKSNCNRSIPEEMNTLCNKLNKIVCLKNESHSKPDSDMSLNFKRPKFRISCFSRDVPFATSPSYPANLLNYLPLYDETPVWPFQKSNPFHSDPGSLRNSPDRFEPPSLTRKILSKFFNDSLEYNISSIPSSSHAASKDKITEIIS